MASPVRVVRRHADSDPINRDKPLKTWTRERLGMDDTCQSASRRFLRISRNFPVFPSSHDGLILCCLGYGRARYTDRVPLSTPDFHAKDNPPTGRDDSVPFHPISSRFIPLYRVISRYIPLYSVVSRLVLFPSIFLLSSRWFPLKQTPASLTLSMRDWLPDKGP